MHVDCRLMPGWAMKPQDPSVEAGSLMCKALILTKHMNASLDASLSWATLEEDISEPCATKSYRLFWVQKLFSATIFCSQKPHTI